MLVSKYSEQNLTKFTFLMKQVKQQEIARKLKLSKATVSRCFTNHPGINPQTRALVFETATELGYQSSRTIKNEVEQKVFGVPLDPKKNIMQIMLIQVKIYLKVFQNTAN